jgi:hypothetical protein
MFRFLLIALALGWLFTCVRAEVNNINTVESVDDISAPHAGELWQPKVGEPWQIILNSTVDLNTTELLEPTEVKIFELDLFDTPKSTIDELHLQGIKVICYFSCGTAEDWRPDYESFKKESKGSCLPRWVGERYIDIRRRDIFEVMKKRIETAKEKGCDAIDPDNIGMSLIRVETTFPLSNHLSIAKTSTAPPLGSALALQSATPSRTSANSPKKPLKMACRPGSKTLKTFLRM